MKKLLVISNHNPNNWRAEQKNGWDKIEFVEFPNVSPTATVSEMIENEVTAICKRIGEFYSSCNDNIEGYVCLQGEFTVCFYVWQTLKNEIENDEIRFIFPTTERVVVEEGDKKISIFKFVRWRWSCVKKRE